MEAKATGDISISDAVTLAAGALVSGVVGVATLVRARREPYMLGLSELELAIPQLPPAFDGYRILHLTDLHISKRGERERRLVDLCRQVQADLIVFTGDYVAKTEGALTECIDVISAILAGRTAYGVLGNNDYNPMIDVDQMAASFAEVGLFLLRNEAVPIDIGVGDVRKTLWLGGVEDPVWEHDDIGATFRAVPADSFRLLLAHSPHPFVGAAQYGIPLLLVGHTHGGQICLPFVGPIYPKNRHMTRYVSGTYRIGDTSMFVSRGVGTNRIPLRLFCTPEVVLVTLRTKA